MVGFPWKTQKVFEEEICVVELCVSVPQQLAVAVRRGLLACGPGLLLIGAWHSLGATDSQVRNMCSPAPFQIIIIALRLG